MSDKAEAFSSSSPLRARPIYEAGIPRFQAKNHHRRRMWLLMLFSDLLGFAVALTITLLANSWFNIFNPSPSDLKYGVVIVICLLFYFNSRLYPGVGISPPEEIKLVTQYTSLSLLIGVFLLGVIERQYLTNIYAFSLVWALAIICVLLARWGTRIWASRMNMWGEPVAIAGNSDRAVELANYFSQRRRLGFVPRIVVAEHFENGLAESKIDRITWEELGDSTGSLVRRRGVNTLLVNLTSLPEIRAQAVLSSFSRSFKNVIFVSDFEWFEGASFKVHDFEGLTGLEAQKNELRKVDAAFKRFFDVFFAVFWGIVLAPVYILISFLIKLDDGGPILYTQKRVGKDGKDFTVYKFRTMVLDADEKLASYLEANPEAYAEWVRIQKLTKDPRITRIGSFLRKWSLDELPQLWNILVGDMSFVGPRPMMPEQVAHYGDTFNSYCSVRPGLSGLWQVSGRSQTTFKERAGFDVYYIRHWSIWLDFYVLIRTVWVTLGRTGAY